MALKAGRRGLNKRLVDAFGNLNGEAPSGDYYTKTQTDNKFETKTHAGNTYQKKTLELPLETLLGSKLTVEDSLYALNEIQKTRQPKTLEVPVKYLMGSQVGVFNTVEEVLSGSYGENGAMTNEDLTDMVTPNNTTFATVKGTATVNTMVKTDNIVIADLRINGVTTDAWESIATIPVGYRPTNNVWFIGTNMTDGIIQRFAFNSDGTVASPSGINNKEIYLHVMWSII